MGLGFTISANIVGIPGKWLHGNYGYYVIAKLSSAPYQSEVKAIVLDNLIYTLIIFGHIILSVFTGESVMQVSQQAQNVDLTLIQY